MGCAMNSVRAVTLDLQAIGTGGAPCKGRNAAHLESQVLSALQSLDCWGTAVVEEIAGSSRTSVTVWFEDSNLGGWLYLARFRSP
eukprot:426263-Amphidinium_carterae.1